MWPGRSLWNAVGDGGSVLIPWRFQISHPQCLGANKKMFFSGNVRSFLYTKNISIYVYLYYVYYMYYICIIWIICIIFSVCIICIISIMCVLCIICVLYIICIYAYIWYCWCFRNLAAAPMSGEVVCPIVEDWFYRSQVVELVILTSPKFLEFWLRIWKKPSTMSFHSSLMPDHNFAQQKTHTHTHIHKNPKLCDKHWGLTLKRLKSWKVRV